jgi:hypothetical protein
MSGTTVRAEVWETLSKLGFFFAAGFLSWACVAAADLRNPFSPQKTGFKIDPKYVRYDGS